MKESLLQNTIIAKRPIQQLRFVKLPPFQGGGIEKVFLLNSPWIKDITVVSRAQVRRAKLYYLRERTGKSARLKTQNLTVSIYK